MRAVWFAAFAIAVLSLAGVAHARAEGPSPGAYLTAREARQHVPPAPKDCPGASAPEECTAVFIPEDGPAGLQWRPVWMSRDQVVCRDAWTADYRVSCTDPDAVPSTDTRMTMCSLGPKREKRDCVLLPSNLQVRVSTPQDALRHPPEVPWDCRKTGANLCTLVVERAGQWGYASDWAPRAEVICVDQEESFRRVGCDSPGAWPVWSDGASDEYATAEEALQHVEPVPERCLDEDGRNTCVTALFSFNRHPSLAWISRWSDPDEVVCYAGYSLEALDQPQIACDDPRAARYYTGYSKVPPRLQVREPAA